jgi:hypothetical protein
MSRMIFNPEHVFSKAASHQVIYISREKIFSNWLVDSFCVCLCVFVCVCVCVCV